MSRIIACTSLLMLLLAGCATKLPQADPLPADVRNHLGTVAIVTTPSNGHLEVATPISGVGSGALWK